MELHNYKSEFESLISIVAEKMHLPESAIERDYYIVLLLKNLADSEYAEKCVFKGGTSLSKCYPGSIERFSEDIDLTFLGMELGDKVCDKTIKKIETVMTVGAETEKIDDERSNRSKSMYVWFGDKSNKVKLEIGSSVRPDPYSKKKIKTYIQEFLENLPEGKSDIKKYKLHSVEINVLNIERTFVDKLMSVKRHAICGTLDKKVRHIYDVTRLFYLPEVQKFLSNTDELKRLMQVTKSTDSFYLEKRNISKEYNPVGPYDFRSWNKYFDEDIMKIYQNLHKELLYSDEPQDFNLAVKTFEEIDKTLKAIEE